MTASRIVEVETILEEVQKDEELRRIVRKLEEDPKRKHNYQLLNQRLLYKGRLVLSNKSALIPSLLPTFHDLVSGGHSSFLRTYKRMSDELHWTEMKSDVKYIE